MNFGYVTVNGVNSNALLVSFHNTKEACHGFSDDAHAGSASELQLRPAAPLEEQLQRVSRYHHRKLFHYQLCRLHPVSHLPEPEELP